MDFKGPFCQQSGLFSSNEAFLQHITSMRELSDPDFIHSRRFPRITIVTIEDNRRYVTSLSVTAGR